MVDNLLIQSKRLKPYLPSHLANVLTVDVSVPEAKSLAEHVSALRKVLATYLPRYLVARIDEDPTPGRKIVHAQYGAVLFADVSGFTAMSERLSALGKEGAEEMTLIVNDYFETMLGISDGYNGDLLKFGGDALVIFFEGEHGPRRALTVATTMQDAMSQYVEVKTSQGVFRLQMSIGIGSGLIFLVNLGKADEMDYAVMGSAMVGMGRAEDVATAGQIVVDQLTQEAMAGKASFLVLEDDLWLLEGLETLEVSDTRMEKESEKEPLSESALVEDILSQTLAELAYVEALSPYVPYELVTRLIPDPLRPIQYGSHRPVTVMFANFYGIDEIIDALGQEHLDVICDILNEYFRTMSVVVDRYGGTINRVDSYVVGHRILALFGALQAHEDDPERAVRAGLEMNRELEGVNHRIREILNGTPDLGMETAELLLKQRIGINTGFVFAGNVGSSNRREFTVMGDQVNLTARLMSVAEGGEVLIGQNTFRHVDTIFELDEKEPVKVKGITDPVRNFVVQGEADRPQQELVKSFPPLFGRDTELEICHQALGKVMQSEGCLLVVSGVSGIGKTRLVEEIISVGKSKDFDLLMGSCLSYGRTLTYHPWAEILRVYFDIRPTDDLTTRILAVERGMEAIDEIDWTPVIGAVLGLDIPDNDLTRDLDAKLRRQRVLDLVVKLLHFESQKRPLMLVIEDAHWADSASMDLINYVARSVADSSILMILPHRPDDGLPEWTAYPHAVDLHLNDLPESACMEIVYSMVGEISIPDSVCHLLLSKASGNPFFIGQVVRALMDTGALVQDDVGQWRFVETDVAVELPDTVHGIIISRVDRLAERDRRLLQAASVVGRVFALETLDGVIHALEGGDGIEDRLGNMEALGLIEIIDFDTKDYRFIHLTTQEVVYESLSYGLRRDVHCQIGNFIEIRHAEMLSEQVDLLAYHYFQGQAWPKALEYNLLGGQHAQAEFANQIAIASYENALLAAIKLGEEQDTSKEMEMAHVSLGEVMTLVGRYEEALDHYESTRTLVEKRSPSTEKLHHLADLSRKTADVYERRSEYELAFEWLEEGLSYLEDQEPSIEMVRIYLLGTGIYRRQGKNDEAIVWCEKSLSLSSEISTHEGQLAQAQAYYNLGGIYFRRGELVRSVESCRESLKVYEKINNIVGQSKALNNLGAALKDQGKWKEASDAYRRSLKIIRQMGDIQELGFVTNNLGNISLNRGEWEQAVELFKESNEIWKKIGAILPDAVTLSNLAQVYIYQEDLASAREALEECQGLFAKVGSEDFLSELERRWSEYHLRAGDLNAALDHIKRSIDSASEKGTRIEMGKSYRVSGEIHSALGSMKEAEEALLQSLQILAEAESDYEVAKTKLALAEYRLEAESMMDLRQLEEAIQTFERLSAQVDLVKAQALKQKAGQ